jgi:Tfp pilus assembly protein PilN
MHNELTNLLPAGKIKEFHVRYFMRLGIVSVCMLAVLVGIHGVLLLPSHFFLTQQIMEEQQKLEVVSTESSSSEEKDFEERLSLLSKNAIQIKDLASSDSASDIFTRTLDIEHKNISILGFTYTAATGKTPGVVAIAGLAKTRDSLRQYQLALQSADFVAAADLPVSSYAKDFDISFTITLKLVTL